MFISGLILVLVLLLHSGPDTPLLRALRLCLVEKLAGKLAKLKRHDVVFVILILAIFLAGGELILLFAPEFVMIYAANLAFYLDGIVISALLATTATLRSVVRQVRAGLPKSMTHFFRSSRPTSRETKSRGVSKATAQNDDADPGFFLKLAA